MRRRRSQPSFLPWWRCFQSVAPSPRKAMCRSPPGLAARRSSTNYSCLWAIGHPARPRTKRCMPYSRPCLPTVLNEPAGSRRLYRQLPEFALASFARRQPCPLLSRTRILHPRAGALGVGLAKNPRGQRWPGQAHRRFYLCLLDAASGQSRSDGHAGVAF